MLPHHSQQFLRADGLGQEAFEPLRQSKGTELLGGVRGQRDDRDLLVAGQSPDFRRGFNAVLAGHLQVHQDQVVANLGSQRDGRVPAACRIHLIARPPEHVGHDALRHGVVFHQQNASGTAVDHRRARPCRRRGRLARHAQWDPHRKQAASPRLTLNLDLTSHQLEQAMHGSKPQAESRVPPPRPCLQRRKGFEQMRQTLRRDADPCVADRHFQHNPLFARTDGPRPQFHLARRRELHGIAQQLGDDLSHAHRVPDHGGGQRIQIRKQPQSLGVSFDAVLVEHALQQLGQVELRLFQGQVAAAQCRVLQGRIQQRQQLLGADAGRDHVLSLHVIQRRFQQQIRHPQDPGQRRADFVVEAGQKVALQTPQLLLALLRAATAELAGAVVHPKAEIGGLG
jgi:hypothetical protein